MLRIILAVLLFLAAPAGAQESVVAGLSQHRVAITANFDGTAILIFGAVKRDSKPPKGQQPLQVVIAVSGPAKPVLVRRKERVFGIWINRSSVKVNAAPSFYAIASTVPLRQALSSAEDHRYKISIGNMVGQATPSGKISDVPAFSKAIIRIRQNNGLYSDSAGHVNLIDDTLFDTQIKLPANLVEGDYKARIFLTRERKVIDSFDTTIAVRKVGMERWIYNLAHRQPLLYGLLSLAIAIGAGWLAATIFRLLRIS